MMIILHLSEILENMILQNRLKIKEGTKLVAAPVTYKFIEGAAGTYTINAEAASVCIVGSLRVIRRQRRR